MWLHAKKHNVYTNGTGPHERRHGRDVARHDIGDVRDCELARAARTVEHAKAEAIGLLRRERLARRHSDENLNRRECMALLDKVLREP
jgi:hypothetical protein